jgi:hypothetical protein
MTARPIPERTAACLLAAVALLTAGCSGGGADASASPKASATASASTAAPSTPAPSPTPAYPTNAAGCHPDKGWSTSQTAEWVKLMRVGYSEPAGAVANQVHLDKSLTGYDGPLCTPVTIQVEFWKITYRAADSGSRALAGETEQYYFAMKSLKRTELRVDGRGARDVLPPKGFASAKTSPCVGFLMAIYAGKPLTSKELPSDIKTGGAAYLNDTVTFPTERVGDYTLTKPSAPNVCDSNGKPTADPSAAVPGASGIPNPYLSPTPSYSPLPLATSTG